MKCCAHIDFGEIAVVAAVAAGVLFFCASTGAGSPPQNTDPALSGWFRSLKSPAYAGESCCSDADGHILADADWRQTRDGYQIRVDGSWWPVPPETVLNNSSNPTGSAVAFWETRQHGEAKSGPHIYCFVRPPET